ncbi:MAG: sensor histidine kinase [Erysipelotrichaceae bacterium]
MKRNSMLTIFLKYIFGYVVIPSFLFLSIMLYFVIDYTLEDTKENSNMMIEQITNGITQDLYFFEYISKSLANDPMLFEAFRAYDEGTLSNVQLDHAISQSIGHSNQVLGIHFQLENASNYIYRSQISQHYLLEDISYIDDEVTYVNNYINRNDIHIALGSKNPYVQQVTLAFENNYLDKQQFMTSFEDYRLFATKYDSSYSTKNQKFEFLNNNLYFHVVQPLDAFDYQIVGIFNYNQFLMLIGQMFMLSLSLFVIVCVFVGIFIYRYRKEVILPLMTTVQQVQQVGNQSKLVFSFPQQRIKEIAVLNSNLHMMLERIVVLIEENKMMADKRLRLEIRALQDQITPHFMYNTLNSIRIKALLNGDEASAGYIKNFASILKSTLDNGNVHTIQDEIHYLRNYAEVMKLRFGSRFQIEVRGEAAIMQEELLKLMVQPLVENSILHANSEREKLTITVDFFEHDGNIKISVLDNGVGISKQDIQDMLSGQKNGIGVYNTNRRIQLFYGEQYGIRYESGENQFTQGKIEIPMIKEGEHA